MSSSFRNTAIALAILAPAAAAVQAQQTYFLPSFETNAEWHNNRDLASDPALEEANGVYYARAEALIGRVTTRSSTELRPWISYQEVPDRQDAEPLELGANLRYSFDTIKGVYRVNARYMQRDAFTSELGSAEFDEFDPDNTPAGESGVISGKGTRTDWTFYPNLSYRFSERVRLEARLDVEQVRYDSNLAFRRVGYDSGLAEATVVFRTTQRFEIIAGPYVSRFDSDDGRNETDSYGLVLGAGYAPAESAYVIAQLRGERADVTSNLAVSPFTVSDTQNNVGFEVVGHYIRPSSQVRYNIGRFLEPGTTGSRVKNDVFRVQYNRQLSARLTAIGAVRYERDNRIDNARGSVTNEEAYFDLSAYYQLTPTWYVGGGYRFIQLQRAIEASTADDHSVFLQFGYRALDPRPRRAQ